jgi:hypothetical protein
MTLFFPLARTTVLIPSGPVGDEDRKHLFIILTNPNAEKLILRVNITKIYSGVFHDPACVLHPGDHEFITSPSYLLYGSATIQSADEIVRGVKDGVLVPKPSLDSGVFALVCKGLTESRFTPPAVKAFYEANS